jgi:hypothetical protein
VREGPHVVAGLGSPPPHTWRLRERRFPGSSWGWRTAQVPGRTRCPHLLRGCTRRPPGSPLPRPPTADAWPTISLVHHQSPSNGARGGRGEGHRGRRDESFDLNSVNASWHACRIPAHSSSPKRGDGPNAGQESRNDARPRPRVGRLPTERPSAGARPKAPTGWPFPARRSVRRRSS